jgi:hypothetical protein
MLPRDLQARLAELGCVRKLVTDRPPPAAEEKAGPVPAAPVPAALPSPVPVAEPLRVDPARKREAAGRIRAMDDRGLADTLASTRAQLARTEARSERLELEIGVKLLSQAAHVRGLEPRAPPRAGNSGKRRNDIER